MNLRRLAIEYQKHLVKNIFNGDKDRFEKAWQQALDEGCEGAVSWKKLIAPTRLPAPPRPCLDLQTGKPGLYCEASFVCTVSVLLHLETPVLTSENFLIIKKVPDK